MDDIVAPYGTYVRVWRGIHYPDHTEEEFPVFYGRIDAVDMTTGGLEIRGSDLAADIRDARFLQPVSSTPGLSIVDQFKVLVQQVLPNVEIVVNLNPIPTEKVSHVTWERERGEALDNLATAIGAEWFASPDGKIYLGPLPAITDTTQPVWTIHGGDTGVLLSTDSRMERQNIYNAVVVNGEPADKPPVYAVAYDDNPLSPLRWGGPFGQVPRFFTSQFVYTQTQAQTTADKILASELSATRFVNVSTVVNPRLMLSDIVAIEDAGDAFDGLYFVSSFDLPLAPEEAMRIAVYTALQVNPDSDSPRFRIGPYRGPHSSDREPG